MSTGLHIPFRVALGAHELLVSLALPDTYPAYREHAVLADEIDLSGPGAACFVAARTGTAAWPGLVVAQRFSPGPDAGFAPGALVIPETDLLLVGAGERLLAYDLARPRRLWTDRADTGFWSWQRHGDTVLMSAELELAAWDIRGGKLWSTFVEPPWNYSVEGDTLFLDVMGAISSFPVVRGPGSATCSRGRP